ncbi:MAG: GNAT family N-acetyltransferase [Pyrinomonadaceae bacterium]
MINENSEIFIRSATNADCENIQKLVFGVLNEFGLKSEINGTDADLTDIEKEYFQRGGIFEVLEDADGNLLGTVGLFPLDKETVELRKMYFDKSLRGLGFGKRMLERMIEKSRQMKFKRIYLETANVLKQAVGLYEKYGFEPTTEGIHSERCDAAYFLNL